MNIKNGIFYHFHNPSYFSNLWTVGSTINFTKKELNAFNSYYERYSPKININNVDYTPHDAIDIILNNKLHLQNEVNSDYIVKELSKIINDLSLYVRETVFEEIRKNYFPSLPSRRTCIWVMEKNSVKYWNSVLGNDFELYELELTGIMHKTDQKYLKWDVISHEEIRKNAFCYWTGSDGSNKIEEELLFEGIVIVKKKITCINDLFM